MQLRRRDTERPRPSRIPSFLNHRRRRTIDTDSIDQPLIPLSRITSKDREAEMLRLRYNDVGLWRLPRRQRRLSIPPAEPNNGPKLLQNTNDQTDCSLFTLPTSVRTRIYENVLGNMLVHIVRRHTKLGHRVCKTGGLPDSCIETRCRGSKTAYGIHKNTGDGGLIQLLQTCRMIYTEAVPLLYSTNTFDFSSLETLLAFSSAILPSRFDSIVRLRLDLQFSLSARYGESNPESDMPRWERTWRVIATMRSLQEVRVRIDWPRGVASGKEITNEKEAAFLQSLELVTGLRVFEVVLPRLEGGGMEGMEGGIGEAIWSLKRCEDWHVGLLEHAEPELEMVPVSSWRS